ncbi:hypothetical protein MMYC01_209267 [Madurella mycetomatis]|uniref:Uncharacterized protein n=1 Tax=Madurella mycetomatis TaxID=100816 RepID=A0A175VT07_9PEZI|nr:hypothetical protein MMYC01_209267 [Madurella mycetomatis]
MPPLPALTSLNNLVGWNTASNFSTALAALADTNDELQPLRVICAWPVSGQYGPGSRVLYYALVAACLLARKTEWLRNACLAAALIFPAVAAIHGVVLAALHQDAAVDMDVYGAFQLCAIGILTAPITVRFSSTYFNNPGRNTIFLWTGLVLTGLLALTVEFFRIEPLQCNNNGSGQPVYDASEFDYGQTTCGLQCSVEEGPRSPMRGGSADNIYVILEPRILTFGAATLLAAACCIPAILSMVSTWDKILKINWKERFGDPDADELIEGTNGATIGKMKGVNSKIREFLSVVEVPLFGGAVLTIIIMGEINFWSQPVWYQTEPMENIGQWAPMVASGLAAIGSLYMLLAERLEAVELEMIPDNRGPSCTCPVHGCGSSRRDSHSDAAETIELPRSPRRAATRETRTRRRTASSGNITAPSRSHSRSDDDAISQNGLHQGLGIFQPVDSRSSGAGKRPEVERILSNIAHKFGTAAPDRHDDHDFKHGKATGFPEIPGEVYRNQDLIRIKEQWGQSGPEDDESLTPRGRRSRANSFVGSVSGAAGISRPASSTPRAQSLHREGTIRPASTTLLTLPTTSPRTSYETGPFVATSPSPELDRPTSRTTVVTLHNGHDSPSIVVSSEPESIEAPNAGPTSSPLLER